MNQNLGEQWLGVGESRETGTGTSIGLLKASRPRRAQSGEGCHCMHLQHWGLRAALGAQGSTGGSGQHWGLRAALKAQGSTGSFGQHLELRAALGAQGSTGGLGAVSCGSSEAAVCMRPLE